MSKMPSDLDPVTQWLQHLRDPGGHVYEDAVRRIFNKYHRQLKRFVAERIADRYNAKVGASDAVQDGLLDFFRRCQAGEYEIRDRGGLLALLTDIVLKKAISAMRAADAQKRSPAKPAGAPSSDAKNDRDESDGVSAESPQALRLSPNLDRVKGKKVVEPQRINRHYRKSHPIKQPVEDDSSLEHDPLDLFLMAADTHVVAAVHEKWAKLDEAEQQLLLLYLQDFTDDEIADRLDLTPRAVGRKMKIIGEKWTAKND